MLDASQPHIRNRCAQRRRRSEKELPKHPGARLPTQSVSPASASRGSQRFASAFAKGQPPPRGLAAPQHQALAPSRSPYRPSRAQPQSRCSLSFIARQARLRQRPRAQRKGRSPESPSKPETPPETSRPTQGQVAGVAMSSSQHAASARHAQQAAPTHLANSHVRARQPCSPSQRLLST